MEFKPFPKLSRLSREIVITEKIDGKNVQIWIDSVANHPTFIPFNGEDKLTSPFLIVGDFIMGFGSRTQWITPMKDNHGFARWAYEHREELVQLGPGHHFGEWWGSGIQRGYGLPKGEKRFSLFNTSRWNVETPPPSCCHVVPVLYTGPFSTVTVDVVLNGLRGASVAAPGFNNPEGVVVFHSASGVLFKKTLDNDAIPKSLVK